MNREKVIKALEFCVNGHFKVELSLATKILVLLKEQQQHIWELQDQVEYLTDKLKEQEAMVKPTKCPCGELFDAKDSSFCPKCGCAYGELSGRYTNIGR